ncbi:MAG: tRNA (cytidine(34)-2'-O)-methyltransferase [Desulfovibrio sp.]|jgi:tRNA (cytidine/uridine-2'-O-)-methyltransferase|nr:tRNA (cytidine(34)-2'-O)-methyltransferase [Desulfovibrio sp.]
MQIVLFEPEIPPNTGNIARLCAATRTELHLIEPLGFSLDNRYLRRAGLDYWPDVLLNVWPNWPAYASSGKLRRAVMASARGGEAVHRFAFDVDDSLVFGPETHGLPPEILSGSPHNVRIPMSNPHARSLNLSTSAGIVLYMALAVCGVLDTYRLA